MTVHPTHYRMLADANVTTAGSLPVPPAPFIDVSCHRQLRGPFTGAGALLRRVLPDLLKQHPGLVRSRQTEITAVAPELTGLGLLPPQTLTNLAGRQERTRFYPATRTLRIAHGIVELLMDWARAMYPDGVVLVFRDLDAADPTDRDLVALLLRRGDPSSLTVVAQSDAASADALGLALEDCALSAGPVMPRPGEDLDADLAQRFIDSDGTSRAPAELRAYRALPAPERARRHDRRAAALTSLGEQTLRYGAIPYHLRNGTDPSGAGVDAYVTAVSECFEMGFYEAVIDLALCGRRLIAEPATRMYWNLTHKVGASLSYLGRGEDAISYFEEIRRGSTDPILHMGAAYQMAMLYTRFLVRESHDEDVALAWVNSAIAFADLEPEPVRRAMIRGFMRNARALVELHRGNADGALALVNEALDITDSQCAPDEQLLHRSVLLYNRAQVRAGTGDHEGSLRDYDDVIARDPDYGDYYFERAAQYRDLGRFDEALADYATAIRLSPPFHEAHYNRADLLRELGDDEAALRDLDYALELEPEHVDTIMNRVDLLITLGKTDRALADIQRGLALDPGNPGLLTARGTLLVGSGEADAARESFDAAVQSDPKFVAAWVNRAILVYSAGRPDEAVHDLDRAIGLLDEPGLRSNRAIALADLGRHDEACRDLDVAITALADQDPELFYRRGLSRLAIGDQDGARVDWEEYLSAAGRDVATSHVEDIEALMSQEAMK